MSLLIRLAIYAAIAAAVLGAIRLAEHWVVIHSSEYQKVQTELTSATERATTAEAALERQRAYAAQLVLDWNKAKADSEAAAKVAKDKSDARYKALQQQLASVPATAVPASAVGLLNAGAAATADAAGEDKANGPGVAPTDTGAAAAGSDLRTVTGWALDVEQRYKSCRDQVKGWNVFFDSLWTDQ